VAGFEINQLFRIPENSLVFNGKKHLPNDYIFFKYENNEKISNEIYFIVKNETSTFRFRMAGTPLRNKIFNILSSTDSSTIYIDFTEINFITSSFADELLGKLLLKVGYITFFKYLRIVNTKENVRFIINNVLKQRIDELQ
jgi:hypothetical protein